MGTRTRSLARMVDEVSDARPSVPPALPQPLLVFLDLKDRVSVSGVVPSVESN